MIEEVVIRPPSEADSLLLKVAYGCSHNKCSFCGAYRGMDFMVKDPARVFAEIEAAARGPFPPPRRVFLADGNAFCLGAGELSRVLDKLALEVPGLQRVSAYANAADILSKTPAELEALRAKKLSLLYLGLESGDDEVLRRVAKGADSARMIEAVVRAQAAGIKASVIALLGLAGRGPASPRHAEATGRAVSRMNPRFFSCLTLMLLENTPLGRAFERGEFELVTPEESLRELRLIVEHLEVRGTVFRADHASNYLPIGGTLPKDKAKVLAAIDACLRGETGMRPESLRGL